MSFWYTNALRAVMAGELDLNAHDIRVLLVTTGTTADTEEDVTTLAGFTALSELVHASYSRKSLVNEAVNADNANNRAEFSSDTPVTWPLLNTGGASVQAAIVYRHVTNDLDSVPIAFIDTGGFPFTVAGVDVNMHQNVEGWLQLVAA